MCVARFKWQALGALVPALLAGLAHGGEPPQVTQLEGTVVFKADGRPAAGVPVAMVHGTRGYLSIDEEGLLAQAEHEMLFGVFPTQNGRYACRAVTDAEGHFILRNYAAANERWLIAAGDAERGYALRSQFNPEESASRPLRLELEPPGFIQLKAPKAPAGMHVFLGVGLADKPIPNAGDGVSETDEEELSDRVSFSSAVLWNQDAGETSRLGPLPGGHRYKVTEYGLGDSLPYPAVLQERLVELTPGAAAEVSLEPQEGITVRGRLTSNKNKLLRKVNVKVRTADGLVIGAISDRKGRYELHGVPPGTHTLELLRHAQRTAPG